MNRFSNRAVITLAVAGSVVLGSLAPAMAAQERVPSFDRSRLDAAQVDYTQYRRGWRNGNRNAAIAGAVGLGILGAAALAASRPAYAEPVYGYEPDYGYDEPVYYRPAPRYYEAPAYGYRRTYGRDPAGGSN